jgi:hypothetical protein
MHADGYLVGRPRPDGLLVVGTETEVTTMVS